MTISANLIEMWAHICALTRILVNTQVKAIKHDGHICTVINVMLASLLEHNKALKMIAGEAIMITVALL